MEIKMDGLITQNYTKIICEDEKEQKFNAPHHFKIINVNNDEVVTEINMQEGPIKENGINGASNEDLIAIVIHRLNKFQDSPYNSEFNELAIDAFEKGLGHLRDRTNKRVAENKEGTSQI